MSQLTDKQPSYANIIREIFKNVNEPIAIRDLAERIFLKRSSQAKNPLQAALNKIKEEQGHQLVYVDSEHVLPLRLAYQNVRYRLHLTKEMIDQAALSVDDYFHHYLPSELKNENIRLVDSRGTPIPFQIVMMPQMVTLFTDFMVERESPMIVMKDWFRSQKFYHKDHILVTVEDWEHGVFRLERERFGELRPDLIAERNHCFADELYKTLESATFKQTYIKIILPMVYARIADKSGYPPDHWRGIVNQDPRMVADSWSIRYADDDPSPLEKLFAEATGQYPTIPDEDYSLEYSQEDAKRVYRFKAVLKHRPSIWREIEIQGEQTLEDLDGILRSVFQHDLSDHLSGFWKRMARGGKSKKQYHEVDIATINPFEEGEGSDTPIAALKLAVKGQIKYVYDFGDWIEHTLELKAISTAEKDVEYPREVGRNQPEYKYCVECQEKGKETQAIWICRECSDAKQTVLLCEECLENHEDHYVDEILY